MNVVKIYQESLSSGNSAVYNTANGAIYTFKELEVATEESPDSSFKVALYWDQQGNGKNLIQIAQVYTIKKSYKITLEDQSSYTATSKSRIITRRHIFGSHGQRETFVKWIADQQ